MMQKLRKLSRFLGREPGLKTAVSGSSCLHSPLMLAMARAGNGSFGVRRRLGIVVNRPSVGPMALDWQVVPVLRSDCRDGAPSRWPVRAGLPALHPWVWPPARSSRIHIRYCLPFPCFTVARSLPEMRACNRHDAAAASPMPMRTRSGHRGKHRGI